MTTYCTVATPLRKPSHGPIVAAARLAAAPSTDRVNPGAVDREVLRLGDRAWLSSLATAVAGLYNRLIERASGPGHPPIDDRDGDDVGLRIIGVTVRRIDQEFCCAVNLLSLGRAQRRKNLLTGHAGVDLAWVDLGQVGNRVRCRIRAPALQGPAKCAYQHDQACAQTARLRAPMMHRVWLTWRSPQDRAPSMKEGGS
jgi:hypothetical protein